MNIPLNIKYILVCDEPKRDARIWYACENTGYFKGDIIYSYTFNINEATLFDTDLEAFQAIITCNRNPSTPIYPRMATCMTSESFWAKTVIMLEDDSTAHA